MLLNNVFTEIRVRIALSVPLQEWQLLKRFNTYTTTAAYGVPRIMALIVVYHGPLCNLNGQNMTHSTIVCSL